MKKLSIIGMFGVACWISACGVATEETTDVSGPSLEAKAQVAQIPKLNLSHIECTEDGKVLAHFVLLFAGKGTPGALTGTYSGGSFGPTSASKNSGNVWHYNVLLPTGEIDIYSATTTTSGGAVVSLHNPSEYSGNYVCGPEEPVCPVQVEPADVYCTDKPLKNPGLECGHFGLIAVEGKDDGLSGTSFAATQDAYVAIVKSGNAGCEPGQSAYRIYVNVSKGDTLLTPVDQDISHVTYCACPVQ